MTTATRPRVKVAPIFLKQKCLRQKQEAQRHAMLRRAYSQIGCAAFISSSLDVIRKDHSHIIEDVLVNDDGIPHYRLTPFSWAWLNHMFANATKACAAGRLDGVIYEQLLDRMSSIYNMALTQFGEADLKSAQRSFSPRKWKHHVERIEARMPCDAQESSEINEMPHCYPVDADGVFHPVSDAAITQVDAIRDKAISLGWTMNQLYRNVGIAHRDWGLVCYLGPVDRVGTITRQSIEIMGSTTAGAHSLRFYNNEVEQPWMKINAKEASK